MNKDDSESQKAVSVSRNFQKESFSRENSLPQEEPQEPLLKNKGDLKIDRRHALEQLLPLAGEALAKKMRVISEGLAKIRKP